VDEFYQKYGRYYEVIEKLQVDKALDEPIRKLALQIANSRKTEDADKLMNEIGEELFGVFSLPGGDPNAYRAALEKVEKASLMDPNNPAILLVLGMAQYLTGQYEDAIKTQNKVHGLEPNAPPIFAVVAETQYYSGQYKDALKTLTEVLDVSRRFLGEQDWSTLYLINQLAWWQATCPAAEVRNGAEAVKNATRVCELTEWKKAQYVDTLAAAYAETGDFDSAVKWQKKAISLLTKEDPAEWPAEFDGRLKLYESGKPYRESP
jgi:tetratricopeptide (TPR) repeat protein